MRVNVKLGTVYIIVIIMIIVYCSLKIMECHSVAQRRVRFINVHLVVRVITMVRVDRPTDVVPLPTGQAILCFILCMDRYVRTEVHFYNPGVVNR